MTCDDIIRHLDALIESQGGAAGEEIYAHLDACPECRDNVEKWKSVRRIFREARKMDVPRDLQEKILKAIRSEQAAEAVPSSSSAGPAPAPEELTVSRVREKTLPFRTRPMYALAAMMLFGLGTWFFYFSTSQWIHTPEVPQGKAFQASPSQKSDEQGLTVTLHLPEAKSVTLVGDFNNWDKDALPLSRDAEGNWRIRIEPGQGYFQYQILVDRRKWYLDPENPVVIPDGFGGFNSGIYL